MKTFLIFFTLVILFVSTGCTATPTPAPTPQPQPTTAPTNTPVPTALPPNTPIPTSSSTPNALGMVFVAQYDPTTQVLTIYGTTPGATIVYNGTPLVPPPTATPTNSPPPSASPTITDTPRPIVVAPRPTQPPKPQISEASLRGKIMFKSARDGGDFPNSFSFYVMNPDGSGVQQLDSEAAQNLYGTLQGREGFSPDGSRVVLQERNLYTCFTCTLYILDTVMDAKLINSQDDISHGQWFSNRGFKAKDPVWSPASNYIAFASDHDADAGCTKSMNIFKKSPQQNAPVRRLTAGPDFCASGDAGHPSFNGAGSRLAFWGNGSGLPQIYVLDVGADDNFDYRMSNAHIISNHQYEDWDPLWVK